MGKDGGRRIWPLLFAFLGVWIGIRYLLPLVLPFLIGWGLAELAEPGVKFLHNRMKWPRPAASALSVGVGLAGVSVLLVVLSAVVYRELGILWQAVPGIVEQLSGLVSRAKDASMSVIRRAPEGLGAPLERMVGSLFAGSSVVLEKAAGAALGFAGGIVSGIPGGALMIGTAVISAFMISAQLPALKKRITGTKYWQMRLAPVVSRVKEAVGGWLKAQAKLLGVTFGIIALGLLLLGSRHVLLWAFLIALVDAIPMLGTGTVLVPWSLLCFLQGNPVRGVGLLGLYVTAMLVRSALEPRVVGRQLGINPLLTLAALYAGFRLWGVTGMILAPIITVTATQLAVKEE